MNYDLNFCRKKSRKKIDQSQLAALFLSSISGIVSEAVPIRVAAVNRRILLAVFFLFIVVQGYRLIREHGVDVANVQIVLDLRLEWRLELQVLQLGPINASVERMGLDLSWIDQTASRITLQQLHTNTLALFKIIISTLEHVPWTTSHEQCR